MKFLPILFLLLFSISVVSAGVLIGETPSDVEGVDIEIPEAPINYSLVPTVNSSNYWDDLDTPADIDHDLLNNLEWSDADHTMDTDLDMNGNDIDEVNDLYVENDIHLGDRIESDSDATTYWKIESGWMRYVISELSVMYLIPRVITFYTNVTMEQNLTVEGEVSVSENITTEKWFNGLFNWTEISKYLTFDGSTLDFSEVELNATILDITKSTTYNATTINVVDGINDSGYVNSTWGFEDGDSYNVSEEANKDFIIYINYTSIDSFDGIALRVWYDANDNKAHDVHACLWHWDLAHWHCEYEPDINYADDFEVYTYSVIDSQLHVGTGGDAGDVRLSLQHDSGSDKGRIAHDFYVDYAVLIDGFSTLTTTAPPTLQQVVDANPNLDSNILSVANSTWDLLNTSNIIIRGSSISNGTDSFTLEELNTTGGVGGNLSWNETRGYLLFVNGTINGTQMKESGRIVSILESWLTTFGNALWCKLTGCTITGDLNVTGNITAISNYICNATDCFSLEDLNTTGGNGNGGAGGLFESIDNDIVNLTAGGLNVSNLTVTENIILDTYYVPVKSGARTITVGSGKDFSTIQDAIDSLPAQISGDIIINIDAGTYNEDVVIKGKVPIGNYLITLQGTLSETQGATAQTSSVQGTGATQGSIDDTGDVGAWTNLILYSSNNDEYRIIDSVTADRMNVAGTWAAAPSGNYIIYDWATKLDSLTLRGNQIGIRVNDIEFISHATVSGVAAAGAVECNEGSESIFKRCKINCAAAKSGARVEGALTWFEQCYFEADGGSSALLLYAISGANIRTFGCRFNGKGESSICIRSQTSAILMRYGTVIDNCDSVGGLLVGQNGYVSCFAPVAHGYDRIRNCASYGILANSGGQVGGTSNNQYSGNGANENAVGGEFAYIA